MLALSGTSVELLSAATDDLYVGGNINNKNACIANDCMNQYYVQ